VLNGYVNGNVIEGNTLLGYLDDDPELLEINDKSVKIKTVAGIATSGNMPDSNILSHTNSNNVLVGRYQAFTYVWKYKILGKKVKDTRSEPRTAVGIIDQDDDSSGDTVAILTGEELDLIEVANIFKDFRVMGINQDGSCQDNNCDNMRIMLLDGGGSSQLYGLYRDTKQENQPIVNFGIDSDDDRSIPQSLLVYKRSLSDDENYCPKNYVPFRDGNSELKEHEWKNGIKLQNCKAKFSDKEIAVFQYGRVIVEDDFWKIYKEKDFGVNNLGKPRQNAVTLENLRVDYIKIEGCQRFDNGLLLWTELDGVWSTKYILHPEPACDDDSADAKMHTQNFISENVKRISSNFNIEQHFTDVTPSHLNYQAIDFVYYKGFVKGYGEGIYKPDNNINRDEFLKILILAKNNIKNNNYYPHSSDGETHSCEYETTYDDVKVGLWSCNFIYFATKEEIVKGYEDGKYFNPGKPINFAEAAKIVVNTLIEPTENATNGNWYDTYVKKLKDKKVTTYDPEHNITRGEMAQIIYELMK